MKGMTNARLSGGGSGTGGIESLVGTSASPLKLFTVMELGKLYYFTGYFYGPNDAIINTTDKFLAFRTVTFDDRPCIIVYDSYYGASTIYSEPWSDTVFIFDNSLNRIYGFMQQNKMGLINGSTARGRDIYAAEVSGTYGQFLLSHGAGNKPQWHTITYVKDASASGNTLTLTLDNNTTVTFTPSGPADYIKSASVNNNTLTLTDKNNNTVTFTPSGPDTYIKSASSVGDTLVLTKQDNTTFTFTPANDHEPAAFIKSASVSGNTLTLTKQDNTTQTFTPANDHEPAAFIKSASVSGNTLTLTKQDNTTETFTPAAALNIIKNTTATIVDQQLANNTSYRYTQPLSELTISFPTLTDDYESEVVFKSGSSVPTLFHNTQNIKWSGSDTSSNSFSPMANKTYNILFWYDSININAIVRGI